MPTKGFPRFKLIFKALFLGLCMAGHFLTHAQQTSQTTTITLAEVTLQAPQLETSRFLLPASVSVINWVPLQGFQQQLSLQEYLRAVPGLFSLNATNYAQDLRLSIRGFGSRAAFGIRGVKIIVDGIPETTPDGQGQVDNLPLGLLSTVEVLRGPSASLYGNAAGGVLYLNTLDDLQGEALRVRTSLGAYGFQNHQLSTSFHKGKTTGLFHFSRTQTVGFRTFSGLEQSLFNAKIKQQFNAKSQLNIQVNYTHSPRAEDAGGLTLAETEADFRQARQRNLEYDTFEKINQFKIGARWNYKWRAQWNFETYGFYSIRDFYGKLPFEEGGIVDLFRNYYGLGARLKFKEVGSQLTHRWQLGIDSQAQADQRDRYLNLQGRQGERVFSQFEQFGTAGLVLLDELQWEKLLLRTGLRLDHQRLGADTIAEDQRYTVLNPSIGLSYALAPRQRIFVNFSTSFETPTLSELSANPTGGTGFNSTLEPAKAINYEGGWKSQHAKGSFELTAFYIESTNEILPYELEAFPGRSFYRNAGATERYGVEIAAAYQWHKWGLQASLTQARYQFAAQESATHAGKILPGLPSSQGFIQLQYSSAQSWEWLFSGDHTGAFFANTANTIEIASFQRLRLQGQKSLTLPWGEVAVFGGINNLLNTTYYDNIRLNAFGGRYYEPAPGRNFYVGVSLGL